MTQDIRWLQRFSNYKKALSQLTKFLQKTDLNELEEQGLIQAFEYSHELAWKVQKDFLESQGVTDLFGSKNVAKEAYRTGLIEDGPIWLKMIESRNLTSHTYNEQTTQKILSAIKDEYFDSFIKLEKRLDSLAEKQQEQ